MKVDFIGIIPARYSSERFPGKSLVDIGGKPMIQRVYEQAILAISDIYVATDDDRIFSAVENFGGKVIMTSKNHQSGTDRCSEAVLKIEEQTGQIFEKVINIQGDEPFLQPEQLNNLKTCFDDPETSIATLIKPAGQNEDIFDANKTKVIINKRKEAIYFSRLPIPYNSGNEKNRWTTLHEYYIHIGLYAFKKDTLLSVSKLPPSPLEIAESLEQLRWLENGYKIKVGITEYESIGVDTPEDIIKIKKLGLI
jgi:3-deoxy-manno-octulosonate cytidylyltransferase (CMP-KDO synthetase)